jgi:hypothetical protein
VATKTWSPLLSSAVLRVSSHNGTLCFPTRALLQRLQMELRSTMPTLHQFNRAAQAPPCGRCSSDGSSLCPWPLPSSGPVA